MAVTASYRDFVVEQLARIAPVRARAMFGGVGLYVDGLFCALIADDTLYFKVDGSNRADYEAVGAGPFMPFGPDGEVMHYYQVPADVLEDDEQLRAWLNKAMAVARRKTKPKRRQRNTATGATWRK